MIRMLIPQVVCWLKCLQPTPRAGTGRRQAEGLRGRPDAVQPVEAVTASVQLLWDWGWSSCALRQCGMQTADGSTSFPARERCFKPLTAAAAAAAGQQAIMEEAADLSKEVFANHVAATSACRTPAKLEKLLVDWLIRFELPRHENKTGCA